MNPSSILPPAQSVLGGEHWRITVLTDRLLRLEYSPLGRFPDSATQLAVNRNFPPADFRVTEYEGKLVLTTAFLRLTYDRRPFSSDGLVIEVSGQNSVFSAVWHYGAIPPKDLLGTARTLDGADGAIPLEHGVLSAEGWSVLSDRGSALVEENGAVSPRPDGEAEDLYFFGYGRDYLGCLRDFYRLTGPTPLLPRFALGNWWSRYYRYSQAEYLHLMDRFAGENLPFTVSVIDMDWHITDVDPKYGTGWTGFSWNRDLFPDPDGFLEDLHRRGLRVTLNLHPADGVRAYEDCYGPFADFMGVDQAHGDPIPFRPADPRFRDGYFRFVLHPLEDQGVDFWWIDWQQGTRSGVAGLDPLWLLNHFQYLDHAARHDRGLLFSRYAGPGSHRYPVGFSGDTMVTWDSLDFQPYFTATASNIGYGWWSHDIGGHMGGFKDGEMALRWLQFGVFSPIMRLHSTNNRFNSKEPWRYSPEIAAAMGEFLRLRHRLIPYTYTMNRRASPSASPCTTATPASGRPTACPTSTASARSCWCAPSPSPPTAPQVSAVSPPGCPRGGGWTSLPVSSMRAAGSWPSTGPGRGSPCWPRRAPSSLWTAATGATTQATRRCWSWLSSPAPTAVSPSGRTTTGATAGTPPAGLRRP